jgi:hypothetical protein
MRNSEQVYRTDDADDEHAGAERHPHPEPLLDDGARLGTVAVEQKRQQLEAHAARQE